MRIFCPPPRLTVSEWADANRRLSREASAESGRWRTARAPYQKGIMDAFSDPAVEKIVFKKCAQVGATEILNNVVGFFVEQDPAPILTVLPTLALGESWSKDRLAPMLRDTPCLNGKVKDRRSRDADNRVLHKVFRGGHLTISGANSPSSLAARPIRILLLDEVDRYPPSAGQEGDPVDLAIKRTSAFWNRKIGIFSTPTVEGGSRIEAAYEESDRREYFIPCPHCKKYQTLKWGQVTWPKDEHDEHEPDKAVYACEHCGCVITDADKPGMLKQGEWRPQGEFSGVAGFHINELYSPWSTFPKVARQFLEARRRGPEALRVFFNTALGETFQETAEAVSDSPLHARREEFGPKVPAGAGILTAGVDVQADRLEVEIVAWGKGEENWSMDYHILYGDTALPDVWESLDMVLGKLWEHESGAFLRILCTLIDSGFRTKEVYSYTALRQRRNIFPSKGVGTPGAPLVSSPSAVGKGRVRLFTVGVDTAKGTLFSYLQIEKPGPGYCHFPIERTPEYFKQLTGERKVKKFYRGHVTGHEWRKTRERNEALDCRVLAMAALAPWSRILEATVRKLNAAAPPNNKGSGIKTLSQGIDHLRK